MVVINTPLIPDMSTQYTYWYRCEVDEYWIIRRLPDGTQDLNDYGGWVDYPVDLVKVEYKEISEEKAQLLFYIDGIYKYPFDSACTRD